MGLFIVEFDLNAKPPLTVKNGDVIVDKGIPTITVRNVEAESYDDAENKARPKVNAFLDELCLEYETNLAIKSPSSFTVMPQDSPDTRHIKTLHVKLRLLGGHRKRIPRILNEVIIKPSDAKTYYRKASMSEDPFDKFRNIYLAIENVASKIAKREGRRRCRDSELIEIALRQCFSANVNSLEKHVSARGFVSTGDTIKDVATLLFKTNRCQLNHSKAFKNKKVPFNPDDEWEVQSAIPISEFIAKSLIKYEETVLTP